MFIWSVVVRESDLPEWEDRLELWTHLTVVIVELKPAWYVVEVHCQDEAEALLIQAAFGGEIAEEADARWAAGMDLETSPVRIRNVFEVSSEANKESTTDHVLMIRSSDAFGDCRHPTTAACLRFLTDLHQERHLPNEFSMLDLGCGTGILAIAAAKLGATRVIGMDLEASAMAESQVNAEINATPEITWIEGDVFAWETDERFHLVGANLFSDTLEKLCPRLADLLENDGWVIMSGLLERFADRCLDTAVANGLQLFEVRQQGSWVTALLKKGVLAK